MEIDQANYEVIWDELPASGLRARTVAALPRLAPYFVTGAEHGRIREGSPVRLSREMLVQGALHQWLQPKHPRTVKDPAAWRLALRYLLEDLRADSGFESLELMVLVHATHVREANGHLPAMRMLVTGQQLLPRSAEIRSDLITDLWALVENVAAIDRGAAFGLIRTLYDGIRFEALSEDVADRLDYANFVALSYLGDHQRRNWLFWRVISKRIRQPELKHRMIRLLNARSNELVGLPFSPFDAQAI